MTIHSRYAAARKWLLFWTLFVGGPHRRGAV